MASIVERLVSVLCVPVSLCFVSGLPASRKSLSAMEGGTSCRRAGRRQSFTSMCVELIDTPRRRNGGEFRASGFSDPAPICCATSLKLAPASISLNLHVGGALADHRLQRRVIFGTIGRLEGRPSGRRVDEHRAVHPSGFITALGSSQA